VPATGFDHQRTARTINASRMVEGANMITRIHVPRRDGRAERVGLVLAGGGARGAYEAGALSVLWPELERLGQRPSMFVGTSVGAVNTAYCAATQHLGAEEAAARGVEAWRELAREGVVRPLLLRQFPLGALRYLGEVLSVPGVRLSSLLDPRPVEQSLERWIDLEQAHRNVSDGLVDALAVTATAARSGRTVVFVEGARDHPSHRSHVIDYVAARIEPEHLRASAAIPVLFPPVRVDTPTEARGWYVDGGTRLNTPIKPALDLGVHRLVVVATDAVVETTASPGRHEGRPPDLIDGALHLMEGALVDPLAEDIVMLGNVNLFFAAGESAAAIRYRDARGKPPYRRVPYVLVAPQRRGALGELAGEIFRARYRGRMSLRSPTLRLLSQLLGGESPAHGELLSYLFFDPEFLQELIEMGQRDARRALAEGPDLDDPWQIGPPSALTSGSRGGQQAGPDGRFAEPSHGA
jgi:NTE family protein